MNDVREVIESTNSCGMLSVLVVLHLAAVTAARYAPAHRNMMGAAGVAALLLVLAWSLTAVGLGDAALVLVSVLLAGAAAYAAALASLLIVPPAVALWNGWKGAIASRRKEVMRWRDKEATRKTVEAMPPRPPPPPPPSKAELLAQAEAAYLEERRLIDLLLLSDAEKDHVKALAERKYLERVAGLMGM